MSDATFISLLEDFAVQLTGDDAHDRAVIAQAALRVANLNAQEQAQLHTYQACGWCGRLYPEEEWIWLTPTHGQRWRNEPGLLEERRDCDWCGHSMTHTERQGERVSSTIAQKSIADRTAPCAVCAVTVWEGEICVVRRDSKGYPTRGVWCSAECEGQTGGRS